MLRSSVTQGKGYFISYKLYRKQLLVEAGALDQIFFFHSGVLSFIRRLVLLSMYTGGAGSGREWVEEGEKYGGGRIRSKEQNKETKHAIKQRPLWRLLLNVAF